MSCEYKTEWVDQVLVVLLNIYHLCVLVVLLNIYQISYQYETLCLS